MNVLPMDYFKERQAGIISLLRDLVETDSPTTVKSAVDNLGQRVALELHTAGAEVRVLPQASAGNHIVGRWGQGEGGILLLAHMDTVFDLGVAAQRPFREENGRLYGPGVQDMKASIAMLLVVMRAFQQEGMALPVTALFTSDEETGSATSRAVIEDLARKAAAVFCLEPALPDGKLKTARKGTGDIEIVVKGVAAHAGASHEKGRNAIEELAHHVLDAQKLTNYKKGTTVNVGVISGGTRANVVPEVASALVDLRVTSLDEYDRLEAWARSIQPVIQGTQVKATILLDRPPMPRDEHMAQAFQKAQAIGRALGLELGEGSTGGGSDANFVAPLGIPVLDGLGAIGDGAHSEREFIRVESLPERAALLAALILNW